MWNGCRRGAGLKLVEVPGLGVHFMVLHYTAFG